jgi:hypothetical protein
MMLTGDPFRRWTRPWLLQELPQLVWWVMPQGRTTIITITATGAITVEAITVEDITVEDITAGAITAVTIVDR